MTQPTDGAPPSPRNDSRLTDRHVNRRTVAKAAVWTVPVVAAVAAAPYAAASTEGVNLWAQAANPTTPRDGVYTSASGDGPFNYYQGPKTLTFTNTFGNFGPEDMPAGALLSFGLPFAAVWTNANLTITNSQGYPLTHVETVNIVQIPADPPTPSMVRRWWRYTLAAPLPAGASFNVTFTAFLNNTWNTSTNHYFVRPAATITTGSAIDVTDTNMDNNTDYSDQYIWINKNNMV